MIQCDKVSTGVDSEISKFDIVHSRPCSFEERQHMFPIYSYPVRCAHNPPPCHFSSVLQSHFLDFGTSEALLFVILEARKPTLEARVPILMISGIVQILGEFWTRKGQPFWRSNRTHNSLFAVLFFLCFFSARFFCFLCFWVP